MSRSSHLRTRLEKAAADNGFDLEQGDVAGYLAFGSSHAPIRLWLTGEEDGTLVAAFSHAGALRSLIENGIEVARLLPQGAVGARAVLDFAELDRLLARALLLARTLPDALWDTYQVRTTGLPRSTEAERLVLQRVGQDLFRQGLMDLWGGRCAISGLAVPELLRASHAKPWKDCESDQERLDVCNGLLLAAHLDAAFDAGLIAVGVNGEVIVSKALSEGALKVLGLDQPRRIEGLLEAHRPYLGWHRARVFVGGGSLTGS